MRREAFPQCSLERALLTKAADAEASRQRAVREGDQQRVAALEEELRKLWREYGDLQRKNR